MLHQLQDWEPLGPGKEGGRPSRAHRAAGRDDGRDVLVALSGKGGSLVARSIARVSPKRTRDAPVSSAPAWRSISASDCRSLRDGRRIDGFGEFYVPVADEDSR
jgi:hypothetical protein